MSELDSVRVALRVRPLVEAETDRGCQVAVKRTRPLEHQVAVNGTELFTYNYVFDVDSTQEEVYTNSVCEMLDKLFAGFNATILAYGQTGSGKTHTMGTTFNGQFNEDVGVIPRAMHDIFKRIEELSDTYEFVVKCSFVELYQEQLYDLLSSKPREQTTVELREDRTGIIMQDLTEEVVTSATETTNCLMRGALGRAVGSTAMNQQSSRSHAIFTVVIQATQKDKLHAVTTSKFHLVDLAGSERSKKTKTTGDRFKEGVKINQGLLALGNVISALGSGQGAGYVRYRDSKLTRLLQDSLGGNSVTLMIACVSPADYNVAETLSTLRYADRARQIKNKPIVNQDPHAAEINHLKGIIQKLRMELLAAGGSMTSSLKGEILNVAPSSQTNAAEITARELQNKMVVQLQEKNRNLQKKLQVTLHDVAENEMRAHIAEAAHEKLKTTTEQLKEIVNGLVEEFHVDSPAEKIVTYIDSVAQIKKLIESIDEELENTQSELDKNKLINSNSSEHDDEHSATNGNDDALMLEEEAAFTNKQIDYKEELRRINRELTIKEDLQLRLAGSLNQFCAVEENAEEKVKEFETKIAQLETEKLELLDKLRCIKKDASAKLAEERRKRLQTLEQEITDMKRKLRNQGKMLDVRHKESLMIKNLNNEIKIMKESKVKLIRAMRQESENFRQWKFTREKELMKLKNKDIKMQNEMKRQEALHVKQRNVLKRKFEEAMANNRRLKDAMERQHTAQSQRQKLQSAKDANAAIMKIEQIISFVEREFEVIISLIEAEHSLEQLMEDRGIISSRIKELKQQPIADGAHEAQEIVSLEEELELRNAQITDIQQKVCAADLESRVRSLCEGFYSIAEARAVIQHIVKLISEMLRDHTNRSQEQKTIVDEQRIQIELAEERYNNLIKRMRAVETEHQKIITNRETMYEEKIAVLLRQLNNTQNTESNTAETSQILEEQLNKMEEMREELEYYKNKIEKMHQESDKNKNKKSKTRLTQSVPTVEEVEEIFSSEDDDEEEDNDFSSKDDPDWQKTPMFKKKRSNNFRRTKSDTSPHSMDETYVTAGSSTDVTTTETINGSNNKRKQKHCKCRGKCVNKRCGCYSNAQKCSLKCSCSTSCNNGKFAEIPPNDENDESQANAIDTSANEQNTSNGNKTFTPPLAPAGSIKSEGTFLTPKIARLSTITFDTASAKKKFFE